MFAQLVATAGRTSQLLSCDDHGRLYAATTDTIRCADTRNLSTDCQRDQKAKRIPTKELHLEKSGLNTLTGLAISRDGSYAALAGTSTLDADCTTLLFVDLTEGNGPLLKQSASSDKRKAYPVHPDLFCHRPGLGVLQVTWHPGSDLHFAVLATDNCWRLYHADKLAEPEQTFELQTSTKRPFGMHFMDDNDIDDVDSCRHAVGFAFGPAYGWERFTVDPLSVLMLCSSYAQIAHSFLYVLWRPSMLPSQALLWRNCYTPSEMSQKQRSPRHMLGWTRFGSYQVDNHHLAAVLLQALSKPAGRATSFSASPAQADSQQPASPSVSALKQSMIRGSDNLPGDGDLATSILATRYGDTCSAVVIGRGSGQVETYVVAGDLTPTWAQGSPACHTEGRHYVAILSEVHIVPPAKNLCMLRDILDLHLPPHTQHWESSSHTPATVHKLQLHPDLSAPDRCYAVQSHGAHAITLPWLPVLCHRFNSAVANGDEDDMPELLPAAAEVLWQSSQTGALLVLDSASQPHCLWPNRAPMAPEDVDSPPSRSAQYDEDVRRASNALFGAVLQGPKPLAPPTDPEAPTGTGNPEGQKLLTDWIGHLRQTHILQELPRLAAEQEQKCEELAAKLMKLQGGQQKTEERLERATQLNTNIKERLKILGNLHWRLLHALNAAEEVFRDKELPEMEEQAKSMRKQIKAMQARAAESIRQADQENAQAQNGSSASPSRACVPPQQLGKMRRILEVQEEGIIKCKQKLALLLSAMTITE
ncbi:MAG: Nuclear pore complex -related isoform 2 [Trebouxia sp. A1-2]|nr:MAG: Nuclear pore complex -related isoform 2 [Trebouxia sp. A1-2]